MIVFRLPSPVYRNLNIRVEELIPEQDAPNCNLCGSSEAKELMRKHQHRIVQCVRCGLVFVSPRLTAEYLKEKIYDSEYFSAARGYGLTDHLGRGKMEIRRRAAAIIDRIEKKSPRGNLLDVGCAGGFFLDAARERGWNTKGVEISSFAAAFARENLKLDVFEGEVTNAPFPNASFDVVTLLDVIEHMPDPSASLRRIYDLIKPGCWLYVVTPNFDSIPRRILGANWGIITPEHHLYFFTAYTLRQMITNSGFKIYRVFYPALGIADLLLSVGTLQRIGIPVTTEKKLSLRKYLGGTRNAIRSAVNMFDEKILKPFLPGAQGVAIHLLAQKQ
ncbi:MAG: class I SAM-dependent methyltransferase [bacterium]